MNIFEEHSAKIRQREQDLADKGVKVFKLSTTERAEFKECRRRWDLASLSRQGLEPNRPALPLWFGTGIHHVLEILYLQRKDTDNQMSLDDEMSLVTAEWAVWVGDSFTKMESTIGKLWDEQKKELEDSVSLGAGMLKGYVAWSRSVDESDNVGISKILHCEEEFQVPIPGEDGKPYQFVDGSGQRWELWLVGRLDMIVQDTDGKVWILDHKTSKDRLQVDKLKLDDQMTVYQWAAQQILGHPVEGCYYNVLRKKLPTVPKVLASGKGLSKAANQDTDYDTYYQAIVDNGFDPVEYIEILDKLAASDPEFFKREKVFRNQHEIAMAGRLLLLEAIDMLNAPFIYPNFTWDCSWKCDFKELCLAMNRNDDVNYLKTTLYRKRKYEDGSVYNRETTNG